MHRHCMHCQSVITMYQPNLMLVQPDAMSIGSGDKAIDLEGLFEVGRYCRGCAPDERDDMSFEQLERMAERGLRLLECYGDTVLDSCPDLVCTTVYEQFVP